MKDKLNAQLEKHSQTLRVVSYSKYRIELSNGVVLDGETPVRKCRRRVLYSKPFIDRFDQVYHCDEKVRLETEKNIKTDLSAKGGNACYEKHKEVMCSRFVGKAPWNKGVSTPAWSKGLSKETDMRMVKRSIAKQGAKNPRWGIRHSDESKQQKSKIMKEKILTGEFTPNSNNRNTHWDSYFKGKKYRSSWEALCQYVYPNAEYESLRIPYILNGERHIYIIDFVDHSAKIVIEVKPLELQTGAVFDMKKRVLIDWANDHGYRFELFDQTHIANLTIDENDREMFDSNTLRKLKAYLK